MKMNSLLREKLKQAPAELKTDVLKRSESKVNTWSYFGRAKGLPLTKSFVNQLMTNLESGQYPEIMKKLEIDFLVSFFMFNQNRSESNREPIKESLPYQAQPKFVENPAAIDQNGSDHRKASLITDLLQKHATALS